MPLNSSQFFEPRTNLIEWVRKQLIGPPVTMVDGPEIRGILPTERFPCGALYPTSPWGEGIDPASYEGIEGEDTSFEADENSPDSATVRRFIPPSSLGFSFFVKGDDIRFQVLCHAVQYEVQGRHRNEWKRQELVSTQGNDEEIENIVCPGTDQCQTFSKLGNKARVDILWRRFTDGWIVTVSLCNTQMVSDDQTARQFTLERAEKTLFERELSLNLTRIRTKKSSTGCKSMIVCDYFLLYISVQDDPTLICGWK